MATAPKEPEVIETPGAIAPGTIVCKTREEWLAARRPLIQASEAPIILGVAPWGSPMELWTKKLGLEPEGESTERMKWGLRLQRVIADEYVERTGQGLSLIDPGEFTIHLSPRFPWMGATLDYLLLDPNRGKGVLEIKTAYSAAEWEEDEPPLHYQVQVQHEMEAAGVEWAVLVVLIAGNRMKSATVERNQRFLSTLIDRELEFRRLLATRTPPPVDGREETARALCALYKTDSGAAVSLPAEAVRVSEEIAALDVRGKEIAEALEQRRNWLRAQIGEASVGLLPDGSGWSWKWQDRAAYSVPAGRTRPLRRMKGRK